jgi:hypothetical protein
VRRINTSGTYDLRLKMPVNVTMKEPRTSVVGRESDRHIITGITNTNNVPPWGIDVVVSGTSGATNNIECVAMQMDRMGSPYSTSGHGQFDSGIER